MLDRAFHTYVFDRDKRPDRAFDELADEIRNIRFDEIARRVIDATPAVSPDQDLLAFLAEVRKVATGYLNLKKEPEHRNVAEFSTVAEKRRSSDVHSMEKEKERIRKLVARSAKVRPA